MILKRLLTITILPTIFVTTSCSTTPVQPASSPAGALTADGSLNNLPARPFGRHHLTSSGFHFLNEFIRPDVRSRLDEEPVGDADSGYEPGSIDPTVSEDPDQPPVATDQPAENEPASTAEDQLPGEGRSDVMKFAWAKKSFGDAVRSSPASTGVIVLYADEEVYDINALMAFVEDGRGRIAEKSGIGGERIQVVFGGYRGLPQIELWVVPEGTMPELKPDVRSRSSEPQD